MNLSLSTPLWHVALLRLAVGLYLFQAGLNKLDAGWLTRPALADQLRRFPAPYEWYRDFLQGVVMPSAPVFAQLVTYGELVAGVLLIVGFLTRWAAGVQFFAVGNYLLAKGWTNPAAGIDKIFLVVLLVVFLADAGRAVGIDGLTGRGGKRRGFGR